MDGVHPPPNGQLRNPLLLSEYQDTPVDLPDEDLDFLIQHFANRISARRSPATGGHALNPGPHVGVINLPSGRLLRCQPKVAVENIFYMLAVVLGFPSPFRDEPVAFENIDDLFDFVVEHFANLVDERLTRGLYRTYVEREDNLGTIRGRIVIGEDVRRNYAQRHRTFCRFTEFTWDVPENRVIRQTAFVVSQMVRREDLRRRLSELDRLLGELDPTPLPLSVFDRFTYHRLNDDYEPIHRLCRLFLEGASVSEQFGEFGFRAFLLDMNALFEQFVTASLEERMQPPFRLHPQFPWWLDDQQRVRIKPDLVLKWHGLPVLPADCKYKRLIESQFKHHDLYQMLSYCTALDLTRGALIYPRNESELSGEVAIRNSDILIRFFDVDLGVSREALPAVLDQLAANLTSWAPVPTMQELVIA